MLKRTFLLATLVPAFALGGCGGTQNRRLESVHQPVVDRADYLFDVNAGPSGLAAGEAGRLGGWLRSLDLGYGDRVAIDDPSAGSLAVRDDVAGEVARYGLLLNDEAPVTAAPVAPGTVRIVVSRMHASVPGCPDHSRVGGPEFEGNTGSNHGCGVNSNLAAMIANPADLVRGQPGADVYDPMQGTKAIETYRKAASSGASGGATTATASAGGNK